MADDTDRKRGTTSKDTSNEPREGGSRDQAGRDTAHGGRLPDDAGKNRRTEAVSWMVAAAIVVVGGGAAAYLYSHGRAPGSVASATPTAVGTSTVNSEHPKVNAAQAGDSATQAKVGSTTSYPDVGTVPKPPVQGAVVEGYGWQYQKSLGLYRDVPGWAFAAAEGTPVKAVLGGRVVANWVDPTEGREVVINSKNGDSIIYGDLEGPGPVIGTSIQADQTFGKVGTPGKLSGVAEPHLFFEVTMNGEPQDPATLLPQVAPVVHAGATTKATGA